MAADAKQELFKHIPSVDRLLMSRGLKDVSTGYPRSLIMISINQILDELRAGILKGDIVEKGAMPEIEQIAGLTVKRLALISGPSLRPVINATGVIIHTNLGRSVMAEKVLNRFRELGGGYSNLEYDLDQGGRGSRYAHVESILKELTSAEAAMVVNNNAAAVLVALDTLAKGREVIISRGQLVEIGGSFRIPDVMQRSGARMVEVGTTNKTHLRDYEEAIGPETALLLKVHTSNFQVVGFTEEVPLSDLAKLGGRFDIPVIEDLGSGCFIDFSKYGLTKEPTVRDSLSSGADLVTFSGDKMLGGPQAGIILGQKALVDSIKKNQLTRALRIDKLTLLALEETLRIYRDERAAIEEIPTLRMICAPYHSMVKKAGRLLELTGKLKSRNFSIESADGASKAGGGALPLLELPSRLICLKPLRLSSHFMERWLRSYDPPIITKIEKEKIFLDPRTMLEKDLKIAAQAIMDLASLEDASII